MLASNKQVMSPIWLVSWAIALATGWLLPNHQPPWSSFHMDAWVAATIALASAVIAWRSSGRIHLHAITMMIAALSLLPALQYVFDVVLLSGTAWISSAYLIGFFLATVTGSKWEVSSPGQLADGLFLAIGIASIGSVGLQLHQWLESSSLEAWSMGNSLGRPFANFGQPNQLATFLLWGLLAAAWGVLRRQIGGPTAILMAMYLLWGLALTQSRTASLGLGIAVIACWYWRSLWPDSRLPWIVTGLALYFIACTNAMAWLGLTLHPDGIAGASDAARVAAELRPLIWSVFVDAALQHPLFGYGWNQIGLAQLTVALAHPSLQVLHAHSHNLFLDLVLWCGIPLGLLVTLALIRWFWTKFLRVRNAEEAVLLLCLLIIANHAMLELPLHYAYFLLPCGLLVGALNARIDSTPVTSVGRWGFLLIWLTAVGLLSLIVRDYLSVEDSYQELRFEQARIRTNGPPAPPDVILLTQFREFIRLARFEPGKDIDQPDIDWMRRVAMTFPGTATLPKLALGLALHGQEIEAIQSLEKACKIESASGCATVRQYWRDQTKVHPEIARVAWPNSDSAPISP